MSNTEILDKLLEELDNHPEQGYELLKKIHGVGETNILIILNEIKKLREDSNKRFDDVNKRFDDVNKRFEANDRKFDALVKAMTDGFKQVNRRLDKHEMWLRKIGGDNLELLSLTWFKAVIEAKGFQSEKLIRDVHFVDEAEISGMRDIQIDIYQEDPMIVVEVSTFIEDISKVELFCKKLDFFNQKFDPKPHPVLITYGFREEIENEALRLINEYNITLVTIGRKMKLDNFS